MTHGAAPPPPDGCSRPAFGVLLAIVVVTGFLPVLIAEARWTRTLATIGAIKAWWPRAEADGRAAARLRACALARGALDAALAEARAAHRSGASIESLTRASSLARTFPQGRDVAFVDVSRRQDGSFGVSCRLEVRVVNRSSFSGIAPESFDLAYDERIAYRATARATFRIAGDRVELVDLVEER